jgi:hypothetical protein
MYTSPGLDELAHPGAIVIITLAEASATNGTNAALKLGIEIAMPILQRRAASAVDLRTV